MTAIQAIETLYKGRRFRSRLEARWAVFFDCMEIPWQYEPEGFRVGKKKRPYLPDFLLGGSLWVEVKGSEGRLDRSLLRTAARDLGELLILGPIPESPPFDKYGGVKWSYFWPLLTDQKYSRMEDASLDHWLEQKRAYFQGGMGFGDDYHDMNGPWLKPRRSDPGDTHSAIAYRQALAARFEHGEQPNILTPVN